MGTVLLVDDEIKLRTLLSRILKSEGFEVVLANDCKSAIKKLEQSSVDVVLCDVRLPDGDGVELTKRIKTQFPEKEILLFTAFGNVADGIRAMKNGAFDYLVKGDDDEKIVHILFRAMEKAQLHKRVQELEGRSFVKHTFASIIGSSKALQHSLELARKVAPTDANVLLLGETGSGKEVFAQAIHNASTRSKKNFVALNCSAFAKDLLESELFGHKAGAFTGAHTDKRGLLQEADGGTLFLDEISEMPVELQAKLLRVLESNEFYRVGETQTTRVDFRLIAASNRDIKRESELQHFRADLYYRLSAFEIQLPPLRDRIEDVELLCRYFVGRYCAKLNKSIPHLGPDYLRALKSYHWPGNIRELKNVIERSLILREGVELTEQTLPLELRGAHRGIGPSQSNLELAEVERLHVLKVLDLCQGNKSEAARLLNIGLTTLYRKLDEYAGLKSE